MESIYYIGMDIHKKTISYCIMLVDGRIVREGKVESTRESLRQWVASIERPWIGAMESTLFTGWVYDSLKPCALDLKVAHPHMLKAITASKKKNDRIDARTITNLLRCDLLPECYMAPAKLRELRRMLRYRNLMVREATRMKNKMSGLLMEVGAIYSKERLHGKRYFENLLETIEDVPESVHDLLRYSRAGLEMFEKIQKQLVSTLVSNDQISKRVGHLTTIPGVGPVTALTWVLEIAVPHRFSSIDNAVSYCGLCSGEQASGGKSYRGPISKKRNKHLQWVLIEAANIAPRWNKDLAEVYNKELQKGDPNRATLNVARKLVAYMLAVDKRQKDFIPRHEMEAV